MAARLWFTPAKSEGLSLTDCNVLNTAARNLWPAPEKPTDLQLMHLRGLYKPGLSAGSLYAEFYARYMPD